MPRRRLVFAINKFGDQVSTLHTKAGVNSYGATIARDRLGRADLDRLTIEQLRNTLASRFNANQRRTCELVDAS